MSQTPGEATVSPTEATALGGQVRPIDGEGAMNGFTAVNGRGSPPSPSAPQTSIDGPREHASVQPRTDAFSRSNMEQQPQQPHINGSEHHHPAAPLSATSNGSQKRKRSPSDVNDASSGASVHSSDSRQASPDVQMHDGHHYTRPGGEHEHHWHDSQVHDGHPDAMHMLAPIQRENQQTSNGSYSSPAQMSGDHGLRPGYQRDEVTSYITTNAGVQMDPKKRKRAFTNRTKTGCQTCRRRKKKCDEGKPECHNCARGGFKCEGYAPKVSWQPDNKMKTTKQPLPVAQSMQQPGPREMQDYASNLHPRPPQRPDQHPYMEMGTPLQPNMRRPGTVDDDGDRSMNNGWSNSPYANPHRGYPNEKDPSPAMTIHGTPHGMRDSYDRPMTSMSTSSLHSMPPVHGMQASPAPHGIIHTAQQALRGTQQINPISFNNNSVNVERAKMLAGELYMPWCSELEEEREKCSSALYSFNNNNHSGPAERMRHLCKVLFSDDSPISRGPGQDSVRVGKGANVDVPFRCEFGYNITIGPDVVIESGCHISDPRKVRIGSGTYIGPGVKIMGKVLERDPSVRGAAALDGKARGYEIHIGKNVHIGANAVIHPKEDLVSGGRLEIGDGAYIEPNATVIKNVPAYVSYGPHSAANDTRDNLLTQIPNGEEKRRLMR